MRMSGKTTSTMIGQRVAGEEAELVTDDRARPPTRHRRLPWSGSCTASSVSWRKAVSRLGCETVRPRRLTAWASRPARSVGADGRGVVGLDPHAWSVGGDRAARRQSGEVGCGSGELELDRADRVLGDDVVDAAASKDAAAFEDRDRRVELRHLGEVVGGVDDRGAVACEVRARRAGAGSGSGHRPPRWARRAARAPGDRPVRWPCAVAAVRRRTAPSPSGRAARSDRAIPASSSIAAPASLRPSPARPVKSRRLSRQDSVGYTPVSWGARPRLARARRGSARRIDAADHDPPGVRAVAARRRSTPASSCRRRFGPSRAVISPGRDLQVHRVQRLAGPVGLREPLHVEHASPVRDGAVSQIRICI